MASIKVYNKTATKMVFSVFKKGDSAVPFSTAWIDANGGSADMDCGSFEVVDIGAQVQNGGVWVGGDPKDGPYGMPGQTYTFTVTKAFTS